MVDESLEPATWAVATPPEEIIEAERRLGMPLPAEWRRYLQRERRLESGWLESGVFVYLHGPAKALEIMDAWQPARSAHPGFFLLGDDGSRDMFCVDLRNLDLGVLLTDIVSSGWRDAQPLDLSIESFIQAVDDGTFDPFAE